MRHTFTIPEARCRARQVAEYEELKKGYYSLYEELPYGSDLESHLGAAIEDEIAPALEAILEVCIKRGDFEPLRRVFDDENIAPHFGCGTPMRRALTNTLLRELRAEIDLPLYEFARALIIREALFDMGKTTIEWETMSSATFDDPVEGEDPDITARIHRPKKHSRRN